MATDPFKALRIPIGEAVTMLEQQGWDTASARKDLAAAIRDGSIPVEAWSTIRHGFVGEPLDYSRLVPDAIDWETSIVQSKINGVYYREDRHPNGPRFDGGEACTSVKLEIHGPHFRRVFRLTERDQPDHLFAAARGQGEKPVEVVKSSVVTYRTGAPGRPSSMHVIEPEFRRRLKTGEAHATNKQEAEHLRNWLKEQHPSAASTSAKTIVNRIGQIRREFLKSTPK